MAEYLHPGVYLDESPAGHPIPGVSTSTTGLIGTEVIRRLQHYVTTDPRRSRDAGEADTTVAMLELAAWLAEQLAARADQILPEGKPYAERLAKAANFLRSFPAVGKSDV